MRRTLIPLVLLAVVITSLPSAHAVDVTHSGTAGQDHELYMSWSWDDGPDSEWGELVIRTTSGAGLDPVGPAASYQATAHFSRYNRDTGSESSFRADWQAIGPTGYTADPVGNAVELDVTLSDTDGGTHPFQLTLTRPRFTQTDLPSTTSPGVNAWWDGSEAEAWASTRAGIRRFDYTVSGAIDGRAFGFSPAGGPCGSPCQHAWTSTWQGAQATPKVSVK